MGFFSAVKKFFGGGTEEAKETQAAAVEKEAAVTSVAPEAPAADTESGAAEPESTPEAATVPAAEEAAAPAEDVPADEAPEAAPEADEPAEEEAGAERGGPAAEAAEESDGTEAVVMDAVPADQPAASEAPAEAGSVVEEAPVAEAEAPAAQDEPSVEPESEAAAEAEEVPAAAAEDEIPSDEVAATEAAAEPVAPEETAGDTAVEADSPEQDDVSVDTAAGVEDEAAEACEEPAEDEAAPADAKEDILSGKEETQLETEAVAAEVETVAEAAREAEEGPLSEEAAETGVADTADAAGDETAAVASAGSDDAVVEETAETGTDAVEEARDDAREEAEEKPEAAAPRRSWWQRIFGSDEDTAWPEAAAQPADTEEAPSAEERETAEEDRADAVEVVEADAAHAEDMDAAGESVTQEPLTEEEEGTESAAAATPEQDEPVAEAVTDAALAATAAAAATATAERPTAPALETCGLDPALAQSMILRLREAEPRLSVWLGIVLEGVEEAGDELWKRLRFLLRSLDAPAAEVDAFVDDFRGWLERMEYVQLDEFRSELQYRLTLALDMEDEEDERSRLFLKISEGLSRTREQFSRRLDSLFSSHGELNESFWEELEELFIMADLGYEPSLELVERLRERARKENVTRVEDVRGLLMAEVDEIFRLPRRISAVNPPEVVLFIGVNGVGKTTSIGKLAAMYKNEGKKVILAAADTFRAAAIEQLEEWADRAGVEIVKHREGADPAAVIYDTIQAGKARNADIIICDTAGRLHNKKNLMEELAKIYRVIDRELPYSDRESLLVLDATTGQNAVNQAKEFKNVAEITGIILTKLDGTAKGGVVLNIKNELGVPVKFIGVGEKVDDLRPFNARAFAEGLFDAEPIEDEEEEKEDE